MFFFGVIPAIAGRLISGDEKQGDLASDRGYRVTPHLSLSCPLHAGNNPHSVQNTAALGVKQAAYGETRTAIIKKKLMKNKNKKIEASAPANAVQQSSKKTSGERAKINWAKRNANRVLNTDALLGLLRTDCPSLFDVAEVVGKWVWVQFSDIPAADIRRQLAELGFHWNKYRQSWQHPCGAFRDKRATYDPRKKYGSYFAADIKPA